MAITKVWVEEGCTSCGLCEDTCPEVFEIDDFSEVKADAVFDGNEDEIEEAAESCPVEVIKFTKA
ncbi:MAG: ferredoxin [Bacteroidales bacterium]|nr:ferredoxin [Bacteroidales bacterium]